MADMKGHLHLVTVQFLMDIPDAVLYPPTYVADIVQVMAEEAIPHVVWHRVTETNDLGLCAPTLKKVYGT